MIPILLSLSAPPTHLLGDNNSNTVITAVVLVLGAILVVIVLAVVMIIVLYVFYKLKNGKAKERSQSFSGKYIPSNLFSMRKDFYTSGTRI